MEAGWVGKQVKWGKQDEWGSRGGTWLGKLHTPKNSMPETIHKCDFPHPCFFLSDRPAFSLNIYIINFWFFFCLFWPVGAWKREFVCFITQKWDQIHVFIIVLVFSNANLFQFFSITFVGDICDLFNWRKIEANDGLKKWKSDNVCNPQPIYDILIIGSKRSKSHFLNYYISLLRQGFEPWSPH